MVAHFSFYGGGDKLHAPLATLQKNLWNEMLQKSQKVAK